MRAFLGAITRPGERRARVSSGSPGPTSLSSPGPLLTSFPRAPVPLRGSGHRRRLAFGRLLRLELALTLRHDLTCAGKGGTELVTGRRKARWDTIGPGRARAHGKQGSKVLCWDEGGATRRLVKTLKEGRDTKTGNRLVNLRRKVGWLGRNQLKYLYEYA